MINAVIVEDEYHSAQTLEIMLKEYCPEVSLMAVYNTVEEAGKGLKTINPDLIFLDVMLPDGNGFDVLESYSGKAFNVVFTTAYDDFALKAIKFSAVDYLLKPIGIEDLKNAVGKVNSSLNKMDVGRIEALLANIKPRSEKMSRIAFPTMEGHSFAYLHNIIRFEAEGSYSIMYLVENEKHLISRPMKEYEQLLQFEGFFRVHYSHFINLSHVKKYVKGNGGYVIMSDGTVVDVASRRKDEFLKALQIH